MRDWLGSPFDAQDAGINRILNAFKSLAKK